jgi:uncharacterized membrane protein
VREVVADADAELAAGLSRGRWSRGTDEFVRVLNFSDGVFGFAMTLLAAGIVVPTINSDEALSVALRGQVPELVAFVITVVVIGWLWMGHHRLFGAFGVVEPGLVFLNVLLLGAVAFLPFSTAVLGRYDSDPLSVVLQASTLALVSVFALLVSMRANAEDCLRVPRTAAERRHTYAAGAAPAVVFLVTIPLAFPLGSWALYVWLLIVPIEWLIDRVLDPARRDAVR